MQIYTLDPCSDGRWQRFLAHHPQASVFHTAGWAQALWQTYRYEPIVYTTCAPGAEITNGQLFCRIDSLLTGRRLVSIPFADHATWLTSGPAEPQPLFSVLEKQVDCKNFKYVEIRPAEASKQGHFCESRRFLWHRLYLNGDLEGIFRNFHQSCVQRKIRRAEKIKIAYAEGRSEELLRLFYRLLILTHRRHRVPVQPLSWFRNLLECLANEIKIRIAMCEGVAIAGMITFSYNKRMTYKYGASDANFHRLGAVPFLFWRAIQEAKQEGMAELDMGRTDLDATGLITFKEHWGATRQMLIYKRYPLTSCRQMIGGLGTGIAKRVLKFMPGNALALAGRLLYRHVG